MQKADSVSAGVVVVHKVLEFVGRGETPDTRRVRIQKVAIGCGIGVMEALQKTSKFFARFCGYAHQRISGRIRNDGSWHPSGSEGTALAQYMT